MGSTLGRDVKQDETLVRSWPVIGGCLAYVRSVPRVDLRPTGFCFCPLALERVGITTSWVPPASRRRGVGFTDAKGNQLLSNLSHTFPAGTLLCYCTAHAIVPPLDSPTTSQEAFSSWWLQGPLGSGSRVPSTAPKDPPARGRQTLRPFHEQHGSGA